MKPVTIILMCSVLIFSSPTFSQDRKPVRNVRRSNPAPIRARPSLSLQAKSKIQLQHSKFRSIHSQAIGMAKRDLNPNTDHEGELITTLEVMGKQTEMLNQKSFENMSIDELVQLVMFESYMNEEEHLKDLLNEMHRMNKIKQRQRELIGSLRKQKQDLRKSLIDGINSAPKDVRPVKRITVSRNVNLISGSDSRTVVDFITDAQGSKIDVSWISDSRSTNASLALNGPGKAGYYQKRDGRGALKITQEITPQISKLGRLWQVSISTPETSRYLRFKGRLTLTYMAHYSQGTRRVSGRKTNALSQTRKSFEQQVNDFHRELGNIQKNYPNQSNDFSIQEAVRHINRASNLFNTVEFDTKLSSQGLPNLLEGIKNNLDGMSEMSEMTSLRLQMTMDRRSKFISTLSQIMKKISTTQDILIQNLK